MRMSTVYVQLVFIQSHVYVQLVFIQVHGISCVWSWLKPLANIKFLIAKASYLNDGQWHVPWVSGAPSSDG
jgi:hypothetical protein